MSNTGPDLVVLILFAEEMVWISWRVFCYSIVECIDRDFYRYGFGHPQRKRHGSYSPGRGIEQGRHGQPLCLVVVVVVVVVASCYFLYCY